MKSRLMTAHHTQNDVASCVRNLYSVLRNVGYLTFNNKESLTYMCETMDIQCKYKGMFILYPDNSLIGKNDSLTMLSVKHPKKI
jgi:hypothetical protein